MKNRLSIAFVIISVLSGMVAAYYYTVSGDTSYLSVFLSALPLILVSIGIRFNQETDPVSPLYILFYLLFVSVFLKSLFLLFFDHWGVGLYKSLDSRGYDILLWGLIVTNLGCVSLLFGYTFLRKRSNYNWKNTRYRNHNINGQRTTFVLTITLIMAVLASAAFITSLNIWADILSGNISVKRTHEDSVGVMRRGSSLGYLRLFGSLWPQILIGVIWSYAAATRSKLDRLNVALIVVTGMVSLVIPIVSSARLPAFQFLLVLLIIYHYYVRPVSVRGASLCAVVLLFALAWLGEIRQTQNIFEQRNESVIDSQYRGVTRLLAGSYLMDIGKTSVIVDTFPDQISFLYGRSFILFAIAPIPRTIWPEKPSARISGYVGETVYDRPDLAGIPPGLLAESYMNFGFVGVLLCFVLLGAIMSVAYRKLVFSQRSPLSRLKYIYFVAIFMFILLTVDFTAAIVHLIVTAVAILFYSKLLFSHR